MTPRDDSTRRIDRSGVTTRAADARSMLDTAQLLIESIDPADWKTAGMNAVHAAIAAADAICGHTLGYHSRGQDHRSAVRILKRATEPDARPGNDLSRLLAEKDVFDYGTSRVTQEGARQVTARAARLVAVMTSTLDR